MGAGSSAVAGDGSHGSPGDINSHSHDSRGNGTHNSNTGAVAAGASSSKLGPTGTHSIPNPRAVRGIARGVATDIDGDENMFVRNVPSSGGCCGCCPTGVCEDCCGEAFKSNSALAYFCAPGATCLTRRQILYLVDLWKTIRRQGKLSDAEAGVGSRAFDSRLVTKDHLQHWLGSSNQSYTGSVLFTYIIMLGQPQNRVPQLRPSEFCRFIERLCSAEGGDLERIMFDVMAAGPVTTRSEQKRQQSRRGLQQDDPTGNGLKMPDFETEARMAASAMRKQRPSIGTAVKGVLYDDIDEFPDGLDSARENKGGFGSSAADGSGSARGGGGGGGGGGTLSGRRPAGPVSAALERARAAGANTGGGSAYGARYVDWRWLMRAHPRLRKALTDAREADRPLQLAFNSIRRERQIDDGSNYMTDAEKSYMKYTIAFTDWRRMVASSSQLLWPVIAIQREVRRLVFGVDFWKKVIGRTVMIERALGTIVTRDMVREDEQEAVAMDGKVWGRIERDIDAESDRVQTGTILGKQAAILKKRQQEQIEEAGSELANGRTDETASAASKDVGGTVVAGSSKSNPADRTMIDLGSGMKDASSASEDLLPTAADGKAASQGRGTAVNSDKDAADMPDGVARVRFVSSDTTGSGLNATAGSPPVIRGSKGSARGRRDSLMTGQEKSEFSQGEIVSRLLDSRFNPDGSKRKTKLEAADAAKAAKPGTVASKPTPYDTDTGITDGEMRAILARLKALLGPRCVKTDRKGRRHVVVGTDGLGRGILPSEMLRMMGGRKGVTRPKGRARSDTYNGVVLKYDVRGVEVTADQIVGLDIAPMPQSQLPRADRKKPTKPPRSPAIPSMGDDVAQGNAGQEESNANPGSDEQVGSGLEDSGDMSRYAKGNRATRRQRAAERALQGSAPGLIRNGSGSEVDRALQRRAQMRSGTGGSSRNIGAGPLGQSAMDLNRSDGIVIPTLALGAQAGVPTDRRARTSSSIASARDDASARGDASRSGTARDAASAAAAGSQGMAVTPMLRRARSAATSEEMLHKQERSLLDRTSIENSGSKATGGDEPGQVSMRQLFGRQRVVRAGGGNENDTHAALPGTPDFGRSASVLPHTSSSPAMRGPWTSSAAALGVRARSRQPIASSNATRRQVASSGKNGAVSATGFRAANSPFFPQPDFDASGKLGASSKQRDEFSALSPALSQSDRMSPIRPSGRISGDDGPAGRGGNNEISFMRASLNQSADAAPGTEVKSPALAASVGAAGAALTPGVKRGRANALRGAMRRTG